MHCKQSADKELPTDRMENPRKTQSGHLLTKLIENLFISQYFKQTVQIHKTLKNDAYVLHILSNYLRIL